MSSVQEIDRVRAHTPGSVNTTIDHKAEDRVYAAAVRPGQDVQGRLSELSAEWDMERILQLNASLVALTGIGLAAWKGKRWLLVPAAVFSFFLQHAVQGWCPPVSIFRRLGFRTRPEINRERYALKAFRGDFAGVGSTDPASR